MIGSFIINARVTAQINDTIQSAGTFAAVAHYADTLTSKFTLLGTFYDMGAPTLAWVYNLNTEAVSEYTNHSYNSMAVIDGVAFGCDAHGLYMLAGTSDNGTAIPASITLATVDYGSNDREAAVRKSMEAIYVAGISSQPVNVTCTTEVGSYTYASRAPLGSTANARIDVGKGLRGRFWTVSVANASGDPIELDAVDLSVASTTRRVGR